MDLNDDLCRTNFYDFISPKLEPGTNINGLTPVAFIDSVDYINSLVTDPNNNLDGPGSNNSSTGSGNDHMKSFLDEVLFDSNGTITLNSHGTTNSSPSTNGSSGDEIETLGLPSINSTFELMGSFQWSCLSNGNGTDSNSDSSSNNNNNHGNWLNSSENEVTTLTNLLDPLFVSYDNEDINSLNNGLPSSTATNTAVTMVSSDHISTTTFHADDSKAYLSSPETIILNGADPEISWHRQNSPNSPFIYCDESLLRSALQTGKLNGTILQSGNINLNTAAIVKANPEHNNNNTSITSMTELRKVLGYPPLSVSSDTTTSNSTPSPTSTSTTSPLPPASSILNPDSCGDAIRQFTGTQQLQHQSPFIEFKIMDPMFQQIESIFIDESNIPNVEELIMTRIDPNNSNKTGGHRKIDISDRKVNSTTLSTKWTYTTNTPKTPKRRRTKNTNGLNGTTKPIETNGIVIETSNESSINNSDSSSSPTNNMSNNATSRKERSLHYCNICNKGFKDKYSVNVHVRTHTGEKPFGCFCGKHFRQKAHLAKHHQTHAAKANGHHKGKRGNSAVPPPSTAALSAPVSAVTATPPAIQIPASS